MKKLTTPRVLYRIEHPEIKIGPFANCDILVTESRHGNGWKYPGLEQDDLPTGPFVYTATRSKKQLRYWFNKQELTLLSHLGYKVIKMKVKDKAQVHHSRVQCVFHQQAVEVLETYCPTKFI